MELDTTKDGSVDLEELTRRLKGQPKVSPLTKIKSQPHHWANLVFQKVKQYIDENNLKILDIFREYDRNNDQHVSHEEFRALLSERIRITLSPSELANLMEILDLDGDGKISYVEFVSTINSY